MSKNNINSVYNSFYVVDNNKDTSAKKQPINQLPQHQIPNTTIKIGDQQPKPEKKNLKGWILGIGSTLLTLGIASIFLTRGGSSKSFEKINKLISKIDDKLYDLSGSNETIGGIHKFLQSCGNGVKKGINWLKLSANFTSLKDTWFRKVTNFKIYIGEKTYQPLKKIADWCTKTSKAMTLRTNKNLATSAISSVDVLSANIGKYADDILSKKGDDLIQIGENKIKVSELFKKEFSYNGETITGKELLQKISNYSKGIKSQADDAFCSIARNQRMENVEKGLTGLEDKVEDAVKFKNIVKNAKQGYITENLSVGSRTQSTKELEKAVNVLTNGIEDMTSKMNSALNNVRGQIDTTDKTSIDLARKLSKKIKAFQALNGTQERLERGNLSKEIKQLTSNLQNSIKNGQYTQAVKTDLTTQLDEITNVLATDKKGSLQEIQTLLRTLHQGKGKTYLTQRQQIQACSKAINKAANFEKNDLYKRLAELKVGAAPTDFGFLAMGAGFGILTVEKEKTIDDKIAAGLTQGIPILGSIGLCLYQTSKGLTGVTPLILALIGGKIMSLIGSSISDKYLSSVNEKRYFLQELTALRMAQTNNNKKA